MRPGLLKALVILSVTSSGALAQAADLTVRVDAREVTRKHVHTDMTLRAKSGPLTLVFAKWIPGRGRPAGG